MIHVWYFFWNYHMQTQFHWNVKLSHADSISLKCQSLFSRQEEKLRKNMDILCWASDHVFELKNRIIKDDGVTHWESWIFYVTEGKRPETYKKLWISHLKTEKQWWIDRMHDLFCETDMWIMFIWQLFEEKCVKYSRFYIDFGNKSIGWF